MGEQDVIPVTSEPETEDTLGAALRAIGVREGGVILVHSSLSSLGWVCGGSLAALRALERAVGRDGTLVMPTHSSDVSEPALWKAPAVPESWWPTIRRAMPAFDRQSTPARGMGAIAELFRNRPGVVRSDHPTCSFAACGPHAAHVVAEQPLEDPFGDASPLATLYDLDASILLLGVGHVRNTTLHLAERRAFGAAQKRVDTGTAISVDGARQWVTFSEPDVSPKDFGRLGADFEHQTGLVRVAKVANARARLCSVRDIVEFAIPWFRTHRADAAG